MVSDWVVRPAEAADLPVAAQLLDAFNREYDDPTPGPRALTARLEHITATGEAVVLLGGRSGQDPVGIAVLRFRPALWSTGQESYLAELYVAPVERGQGLGRGILTAALRLARERGADSMDLGTSADDVAARALYESVGFINRERPDGPITYFYELELTSDRGEDQGPAPSG